MKAYRILAVLAALAGTLGVAAPAAGAESEPRVRHQAWSSSNPAAESTGDEESIYTAAAGGAPVSIAYVQLDGDTGTLSAASVVLDEATDTVAPDQAKITACQLRSPLAADGYQDKPLEYDCEVSAKAQRDSSGQWRVPLGAFAAKWAAGAPTGFALVPAADQTGSWQLSLQRGATRLISPAGPGSSNDVSPPPVPQPEAASAPEGASGPAQTGPAPTGGEPAAEQAPALAAPEPPEGPPADDVAPPELAEPQAPAAADAAPQTANSPSSWLILALVALVTIAVFTMIRRGLWVRKPADTAGATPRPSTGPALVGLGLLATVPLLGEADLFNVGLVLIIAVAAIGLHLLVNWTGELSLAHSAFVGVPAFTVAGLAARLDVSPIYLIPIGALVGALLGVVVGLPALRAKGLQVALVTLAVGVAANEYLFTQEWMVGPSGGFELPPISLGPITFDSSASLYPLLAICVALAVTVAWILYRSASVRAMLWIRADSTAASAFGVPVAAYKLFAYGITGGFAGYAGALLVIWTGRVTPGTFPFAMSFLFLLIVVLAGRGFVGGVIAATALVYGGTLFISDSGALGYLGPVALLLNITRYKAGLNGIGGWIMERVRGRLPVRGSTASQQSPPPQQATRPYLMGGVASLAVGAVAIGLAWYHAGNTNQLWIQNQELISGGIGGLALVLLGTGLMVADRLAVNHAELMQSVGAPASEFADRAHADEYYTQDLTDELADTKVFESRLDGSRVGA